MYVEDTYVVEDTYEVGKSGKVTVRVTVSDSAFEQDFIALLEPQQSQDEITLQEDDVLCVLAEPRKALVKAHAKAKAAPNRQTVRVRGR